MEDNRTEKIFPENKATSQTVVQIGCFPNSEHGRQNKRLFCIACILTVIGIWIAFFMCVYYSNFAQVNNDDSSDTLAFE